MPSSCSGSASMKLKSRKTNKKAAPSLACSPSLSLARLRSLVKPCIYRASIVHLSCIYRTSIVHLSCSKSTFPSIVWGTVLARSRLDSLSPRSRSLALARLDSPRSLALASLDSPRSLALARLDSPRSLALACARSFI